jgi:hypothetical protein
MKTPGWSWLTWIRYSDIGEIPFSAGAAEEFPPDMTARRIHFHLSRNLSAPPREIFNGGGDEACGLKANQAVA